MKADEAGNGVFSREFIGPDCCVTMPNDFLFVEVHPSATSAQSHSEMEDRRAYIAHPALGAVFPPPCDSCGTVGDESIILGPDGNASVQWRRANYVLTIYGSSADSIATTIACARIMDALHAEVLLRAGGERQA